MLGISWNQLITFNIFLHWLQCNFSLTVLSIFSTMILATFQSSLLAGSIRRYLGLILKFSYGLLLLSRLVFFPYIQLFLLFQVFCNMFCFQINTVVNGVIRLFICFCDVISFLMWFFHVVNVPCFICENKYFFGSFLLF